MTKNEWFEIREYNKNNLRCGVCGVIKRYITIRATDRNYEQPWCLECFRKEVNND